MQPIILEAEGHRCEIETVTTDLTGRLKKLIGGRRGLILLDYAFWAGASIFADHFPGFKTVFTEKSGEAAKTMAEAARIFDMMMAAKLNRDDFLIVRGGGSLTDLGAFCAGLYKRGMNLILIPTTLLGAVDAAVGGKTAINFYGAKNQIGQFYLPTNVLVDVEAFSTLPPECVNDGLVEAYKTGLLFDSRLRQIIENKNDAPLNLAEIATRSYTAKAAVVAKDFREERGVRDVLNLGHTYGHVIESYYGPGDMSHGRAVAVGLAVAAELSRPKLGDSKADAIIARSKRLAGGFFPKVPPENAIRVLLSTDKKIRGEKSRFILLDDFEKPRIEAIEPDTLSGALKHIFTERSVGAE